MITTSEMRAELKKDRLTVLKMFPDFDYVNLLNSGNSHGEIEEKFITYFNENFANNETEAKFFLREITAMNFY